MLKCKKKLGINEKETLIILFPKRNGMIHN